MAEETPTTAVDTNEIQAMQGNDTVLFARKLKDASKISGQMIPYQTNTTLGMTRDSDSNSTKSGSVPTQSALSTELSVEFMNNWSKIADQLYDSLVDGERMEFWVVYRKRLNATGQVFAWYMRGTVSEDSNENESDDNSTRETTIQIEGTPQRGWTDLSEEAKEKLSYVFKGLGVRATEDADGDGTAWKDSDAGVGTETAPITPSV